MSTRDEFETALDAACQRLGAARDGRRVELALEDGRHQVVSLDYFEFDDEELARVYTEIGNSSEIEPLRLVSALRLNFGLAHGAFALRDEQLVLVDTLLVEDPDPDEIEASIAYLAELGDRFERTLFGGDEF